MSFIGHSRMLVPGRLLVEIIWGWLIAAVGLLLFVSGTIKSQFFVYRLLVARSKILWGDRVHGFHQVAVILVVASGILFAVGVIRQRSLSDIAQLRSGSSGSRQRARSTFSPPGFRATHQPLMPLGLSPFTDSVTELSLPASTDNDYAFGFESRGVRDVDYIRPRPLTQISALHLDRFLGGAQAGLYISQRIRIGSGNA